MADLPNRLDPGTSYEDNLSIINQAFDEIDAENQTKIVSNGNVPTILFGRQVGGFAGQDYGLKIAKPGINVTTATDDELAFSSAFDNLKVVATDVVTINYTGTGFESFDIPHGLSFTPVAIVATEDSSTRSPLPYLTIGSLPGGGQTGFLIGLMIDFTTDDTNLTIRFQADPTVGAAVAGPWIFRYYLLQETAT